VLAHFFPAGKNVACGPEAIVKSQHKLLGAEGQCRRKLFATDPRRPFRINLNDTFGIKRL
jgi:hypothetical protein